MANCIELFNLFKQCEDQNAEFFAWSDNYCKIDGYYSHCSLTTNNSKHDIRFNNFSQFDELAKEIHDAISKQIVKRRRLAEMGGLVWSNAPTSFTLTKMPK